jgi:hypothetical protein
VQKSFYQAFTNAREKHSTSDQLNSRQQFHSWRRNEYSLGYVLLIRCAMNVPHTISRVLVLRSPADTEARI